MLIKCPECGLQASDKALSCPHCGLPFQQDVKPKQPRKYNKRRRLPNGFGQITEIKNRNLRNPFRAMVTIGKTDTGRPICKPLKPVAFFSTYNEAYAALVEYNKNPYDLESSITVKELYEKWTDEYFKTISDSAIRSITAAWAYCSVLYGMRVVDVRARHIKGCMEDGTAVVRGKTKPASPNTKARIKSMFNLLLDYAVEYEIVDRNYGRTFDVPSEIIKEQKKNKKEHISFSEDEMQILWDRVDEVPYADAVLIQCYSGWRPQELVVIKLENVNLEKWCFEGGMKSDAGTDRIVPIHSRIRHLVEKKYKEALALGSPNLINTVDPRTHRDTVTLTYDKYRKRFNKLRDELKLNPHHRAHDPRMQFITMAKKYSVDEYAIKNMVGHAINDVTEKVYTKRDLEWLRSEMEKIK